MSSVTRAITEETHNGAMCGGTTRSGRGHESPARRLPEGVEHARRVLGSKARQNVSPARSSAMKVSSIRRAQPSTALMSERSGVVVRWRPKPVQARTIPAGTMPSSGKA